MKSDWKWKDIHFVGNKKRAGFDFPDYELIVNGISSCELINRISSKEPHSAQKQLREEFMNLNLTEEEAKVKEKYMKHLLCVKTKSEHGPGHVYAPNLSCVPNEFEDSFDDEDTALYDEVYEQPYTLL